MHTIYKYTPVLNDEVEIVVPAESQLLSADFQYGDLCFWFMVDTDETPVVRRYYVIGTGHPIPPDTGSHVATVQDMGGRLIWHIFDKVD